jgi:hypothetical protein
MENGCVWIGIYTNINGYIAIGLHDIVLYKHNSCFKNTEKPLTEKKCKKNMGNYSFENKKISREITNVFTQHFL